MLGTTAYTACVLADVQSIRPLWVAGVLWVLSVLNILRVPGFRGSDFLDFLVSRPVFPPDGPPDPGPYAFSPDFPHHHFPPHPHATSWSRGDLQHRG